MFIRIVSGNNQVGNMVFLLHRNSEDGSYCVESYLNGFLNKYCTEQING